jgi:hypothetical protein
MALKDIKEDVKDSIKKANAEAGAERVKKMTLPERSIGPDMNRVTPKPSSIADRFNLMETDAVKRGADKAKAKATTVPVGQSEDDMSIGKKCGGKVKKYARGGGIEVRGKTKGRMI